MCLYGIMELISAVVDSLPVSVAPALKPVLSSKQVENVVVVDDPAVSKPSVRQSSGVESPGRASLHQGLSRGSPASTLPAANNQIDLQHCCINKPYSARAARARWGPAQLRTANSSGDNS